MFQKKRLTKEQSLEKIKQYCAYQERCHKEVKQKLYSYGTSKNDAEEIIVNLIDSNFLNEERFAVLFAGGKFRMKRWGKKKIVFELQQKGVSTYCINQAIKEIPEDIYIETLTDLAIRKWESLQEEPVLTRYAKTNAHLIQKGYEHQLISEVIGKIRGKQ